MIALIDVNGSSSKQHGSVIGCSTVFVSQHACQSFICPVYLNAYTLLLHLLHNSTSFQSTGLWIRSLNLEARVGQAKSERHTRRRRWWR
jgi:hypothetical protein